MAAGDRVVHRDLIVSPVKGRGARYMQTDGAPGTSLFGWRDWEGMIRPKASGAGTPTLRTLQAGGHYQEWSFASGDHCDNSFHTKHSCVESTDIYIHPHHLHNGSSATGNLVIDFWVSYGKGHNRGVLSAEKQVTLTVNYATKTSLWTQIDDVLIGTPGGSATCFDSDQIEPDGLITVGYDVTTAPTVTGGHFFIMFLDIHAQTTEAYAGTKNRSPDFYGT